MHCPADHGPKSRSPNGVLELYILTQRANGLLSIPMCHFYLLHKPRHVAMINRQTAFLCDLLELVDLIVNPLKFVPISSHRLLQTLQFHLSSSFGLPVVIEVRYSSLVFPYFRFLVLHRSLELPLDLFTLGIAPQFALFDCKLPFKLLDLVLLVLEVHSELLAV